LQHEIGAANSLRDLPENPRDFSTMAALGALRDKWPHEMRNPDAVLDTASTSALTLDFAFLLLVAFSHGR
jgi:hypothetical protein